MKPDIAKTTAGPPWVANLYDSYVSTADDIPFFLQEAEATEGSVLELMAGTGRISVPLAEAGVNLTCVDLSGPMLGRLRDKLTTKKLNVDVVQQDVSELALKRKDYALAILPFQSFAELVSPDQQKNTLDRVAQHLKPGGRFICTHHNSAVRSKSVDGILHMRGEFPEVNSSRRIRLWTCEEQIAGTDIVKALQVFEIFDKDGMRDEERRFEVNYRLVDCDSFRELAESAGFRVIDIFGDYSKGPFWTEESTYVIWMLERA